MAADESVPSSQRAERAFFSVMAASILVAAFVGFAPSYFLRPVLPAPSPASLGFTPLVHLHAFLFTGWTVLFLIQVRLVAAKRVDLHQRLGILGVLMAVLMVGTGTLTAVHAVLRGVAPFGMDPRRFLIVPLFAVVMFAIFVIAGFRARRNPQSHKRLMLLATIALLPPAIARLVLAIGLGPPFVFGIATLFLVPIVVWDLKTRRRLHRVTLWGGLLLFISGPLRLVLAQTDGWLAISNWLVGQLR